MNKRLLRVLPVVILVLFSVVFFWKFFLRGLIPFPGDLLVGAYFPWLEDKWGYVVGVPIKNPLISDVYSQLYIWKSMVVDSISQLKWPLWNPTMYSGYPLLANFQSGVLNILNIFPLIFGMVKGWGLMLWLQVLGSGLTMYFLLNKFRFSNTGSLTGAVVYAFGGFPIVWMEYATVGQAMIWIPLVFLAIETAKYYWLPVLFLFIVGAGHFQALVYTAFLAIGYFFFKYWRSLGKELPKFTLFGLLSVGLSAVQLIPTVEMSMKGIRFAENYVKDFNFGLAPVQQLVTLLAPDFFGNPTTANYWGEFNYENVIYYSGIIAAVALGYFIFRWRKTGLEKFFVVAALLALLLGFDTPVGKAVYIFHFPGLSTSVAGRIGLVFTLSVAVLVGSLVDKLKEIELKPMIKSILFWILLFAMYGVILFGSSMEFARAEYGDLFRQDRLNMIVGLRNSLLPAAFFVVLASFLTVFRKCRLAGVAVLLVTTLELFRFGWKYTTFSPSNLIYPEMKVMSFIQDQKGTFRVERENAEIMPPNTWSAYGFQSPAGYDPMSVSSYVKQFNFDINKNNDPGVSRYTEANNFSAEDLGRYNVKYLLAIKRNEQAIVPGDNINYKINEKEWRRVFQTPAVAVLENTKYQERARIVRSDGSLAEGKAEIMVYQNELVKISFENVDGDKLLLADSYYPGWTAKINGVSTKIGDEIKPFRTVDIRGVKSGEVVFEYRPLSFRVGLWVSIISLSLWLLFVVTKRKNEK